MMIQVPVSLLSSIKSFVETASACDKLENHRNSIISTINDLVSSSPLLSEEQMHYKKPEIPPAIACKENADSIIDPVTSFLTFGHWIGSLKTLKRTGWLNQGLSSGQAESVAEHSYRMAMLLFALFQLMPGNVTFSLETAMKMCLVHDAAEAIVGDIPPSANISKEVKLSQERDAMLFLDSIIATSDAHSEFYKMWDCYEERNCTESKIVKDLDRLELLLQAYEYKLSHPDIDGDSFFENTLPHIQIPFIKQCAERLNELRLRPSTTNNK